MRLAAVPVCRVVPSNIPCSLPPTQQFLVATEASFFIGKADHSTEVFYHEERDPTCIFLIDGLGLNMVETRFSEKMVLDDFLFIHANDHQG